MKSLLVLILVLIFLVPLASNAFAASTPEVTPSAAIKLTRLPFKGTIQSTETYVTVSPMMSVTASGSGDATQIGQFTINYELEVNLLDLSGTGSVYFAGDEETLPVETAVGSLAGEGGVQAPPSITSHTIHRKRSLRFFILAPFIPAVNWMFWSSHLDLLVPS